MSSSPVSYKSQSFWVNDGALEYVMFAFVREIDQLNDIPDWLLQVRNDWYAWASAGFTGSAMTNLDEFANTDEKKRILAGLGRLALKRIEVPLPLLKGDLWIEKWGGFSTPSCFLETEVAEWRSGPKLRGIITQTLRMFILLMEGQQMDLDTPWEASLSQWKP